MSGEAGGGLVECRRVLRVILSDGVLGLFGLRGNLKVSL